MNYRLLLDSKGELFVAAKNIKNWKLYKSAKNMRWISKGYCENGSKSLGMKKEIELFSIHPLNILCEQDYF